MATWKNSGRLGNQKGQFIPREDTQERFVQSEGGVNQPNSDTNSPSLNQPSSTQMPSVHQRWIEEFENRIGQFVTLNATVVDTIWEFRGIVTEVTEVFVILEDSRIGSQVIVPYEIVNFIDLPIEPTPNEMT